MPETWQRKKGRAETIIEDLAKRNLYFVGVKEDNGKEILIEIDKENPYRTGDTFSTSDYYRVYNSSGETVIEKRRLSGIRKWIDCGDVDRHEEFSKKHEIMQQIANLVGKL